MMQVADIGVLTAFVTGIASFLSPCVLPLMPGCISYVAGSAAEISPAGTMAWRWPAVGLSVCFVLGLANIRWLQREIRMHPAIVGGRPAFAYMLGLIFACGGTPYIGASLGAVPTMSATTATVARGVSLPAVYSPGLGVPFVLAALFTDGLVARLKVIGRLGARPANPWRRSIGAGGRRHDHRTVHGHRLLVARCLSHPGRDRLRLHPVPASVRCCVVAFVEIGQMTPPACARMRAIARGDAGAQAMLELAMTSNLEWGWFEIVGLWLLTPLVSISASLSVVERWPRRHCERESTMRPWMEALRWAPCRGLATGQSRPPYKRRSRTRSSTPADRWTSSSGWSATMPDCRPSPRRLDPLGA